MHWCFLGARFSLRKKRHYIYEMGKGNKAPCDDELELEVLMWTQFLKFGYIYIHLYLDLSMVYVCVCVCMNTYIDIYVNINMCIAIYACLYMYTCILWCMHLSIYMHVFLNSVFWKHQGAKTFLLGMPNAQILVSNTIHH